MIRHQLTRYVINFVLFQIAWLICIVFPGLISAGIALAFVALHLMLVSLRPRREIQFILLGTLLGSLVDGLWFKLGVLLEPGARPIWTPIWLICLWAVFMTTLCHSLAWIGKSRWLPFVLAPIVGPLTYWSSARLGRVELPDPVFSLIALAVGWVLLFPLLLHIKRRYFKELTPA